jgi:hypothetical protein
MKSLPKVGPRLIIEKQWLLILNSKWLLGTKDLNRDSVIQIHNHWVPLKKMMFGTRFLSED